MRQKSQKRRRKATSVTAKIILTFVNWKSNKIFKYKPQEREKSTTTATTAARTATTMSQRRNVQSATEKNESTLVKTVCKVTPYFVTSAPKPDESERRKFSYKSVMIRKKKKKKTKKTRRRNTIASKPFKLKLKGHSNSHGANFLVRSLILNAIFILCYDLSVTFLFRLGLNWLFLSLWNK